MKQLLALLVTLSFLNCKNNKGEIEFNSQKVKEINEITKTVFLEENYNDSKNEKKSKTLCEELIKVDILIPEKRKSNERIPPPPPFFKNISIEELLNTKIENEIFFSTKDSLYLLQQNMNPPKFNIDRKMLLGINFTTKENEINKKKLTKSFDFYEMSIPFLSLNNQKAYVILNHYCGRLCGSGKVIYLKKIKGKWNIIETRRTWIS